MDEEVDSWQKLYPFAIGFGIFVAILAQFMGLPHLEKPFIIGSILTATALYSLLALPLYRFLGRQPNHFSRYSLLTYTCLLALSVCVALFTDSTTIMFSMPALAVLLLGLLFAITNVFNDRYGDKTMIIVAYNLIMMVSIFCCVAGLLFIAMRMFG